MFPQALRLRRDASFLNVNRLVDVIYQERIIFFLAFTSPPSSYK